MRDYRTGTGEPGNFQLELLVYGREGEPCRRCGTRLAGHARDRRPHLRLLPPLPVVSPARRAQRAVPLPATDLEQLRQRVRALAENRPAVYRMTDAMGRVIYVGKAKRLRTRLLTYFRADYPDDKAARILYAASDIAWDYVPSEFAAYLGELRQIRKFRPHFNHRGNVTRRSVLIKISERPRRRGSTPGRPSPETTRAATGRSARWRGRCEAVRTLNDLLGLRDCTAEMPAVFAGQGDLFDQPRQAGVHAPRVRRSAAGRARDS